MLKKARHLFNRLTTLALLVGAALVLPSSAVADAPEFSETAAQRDARMQWWRESRFGMFIHWGLYAVPAKGEWYMYGAKEPLAHYQAYAKQFNPVKWDADAVAALAKRAGMKYIVITAKHHEGFAMWPTKVDGLNIHDATPLKRDVLRELKDACVKHGLKFGVYYSHGQDWNHPGGGVAGGKTWDPLQKSDTFDNYARKVAVPHCKELLENYRPDLFWWDSSVWRWNDQNTPWMYEVFKPYLKTIILNNRWHDGLRLKQFESAAYFSDAKGMDHFIRGDYATPECHFPKSVPPEGLDWEACTSIKWHWGYHATDPRFQSARYIVRSLVHVASQGGNFLLNIGPTAEGTVPPPSVERLEQVGRWMATYGDSIYDTKGGPFYHVFESGALGSGQDIPLPWNTAPDFTRKEGKLFVHVYELPADRRIVIPPLKNKVEGIRLVRDPKVAIPYTVKDGHVVATLPAAVTPNPFDEVLVVSTAGWPEAADAPAKSTGAVNLENDLYITRIDAAAGSFTIAHKPSGKTFLRDGVLCGKGGTAKQVETQDKTFGKGKAVEIAYPDGNRETVSLYPGLPFVLFRSKYRNSGKEDLVLNRVPSVSAAVHTGEANRRFGSGGGMGSYTFMAIVDPPSRNGVVFGWLTHDRGNGVAFASETGGVTRVTTEMHYGRLLLKPGEEAAGEALAIGYFDDARLGLENYADSMAKVYAIELPPNRSGLCTWYMEKYNGSCTETRLPVLVEYAAKNLKPYGFDFIQIDDGWQEGCSSDGPRKNFTTHRSEPGGHYPSGMKATADIIRKTGLTPGLWFMPFAGRTEDPYFMDHQDWFAKGTNGMAFRANWSGHALDMTHPAVRDNLKENIVRRIAHDWGYKFFKMDGFYLGLAARHMYSSDNGYREDDFGGVTFRDPAKTPVEIMRSGVALVREAAGPDVFLLGCTLAMNMRALSGSIGLVDSMRVGADGFASKQASQLWFLNGRIWWNDPDCVAARTKTPLEYARMTASFTALAGNLFYTSDWMPDYPPERLDIVRRCIPAHGLLTTRPVDIFENMPARIWHLYDTRGSVRRDVVALYNWDKKATAAVSASPARIGLPPAAEYVGFDFWANRFVPPFKGDVSAELKPQSCRVLAIRPVSANPQVISTSRHITQGIVDVCGERWDAGKAELSGVSKVVGGDPYELRIAVPIGEKSWRITGVTVSSEDAAARVTTAYRQDGFGVRAVLVSPAGRAVKWAVKFKPAAVTETIALVSDTFAAVEAAKAAAMQPMVPTIFKPVNINASSIWPDERHRFEARHAFDGDYETRWTANPYTNKAIAWKGEWLEADMGKPVKFSRVDIVEGLQSRVKKYEIRFKDGEAWKTVATGTTIPGRATAVFDSVTAQFIRVVFVDATGAPTIQEVEIME